MSNIVGFLEARIAEDEEEAREFQKYEDQISETAGWWEPTRVLAECVAKRSMLANIPKASDPFDPLGGTSEYVLRCLATVYSDHPDFNPSWR